MNFTAEIQGTDLVVNGVRVSLGIIHEIFIEPDPKQMVIFQREGDRVVCQNMYTDADLERLKIA